MWIQIIILTYLCVYIVKLIEGPSIWNRLLCMNLITTKIILMIIVFASMHDTGYFLDFAIIYAICGFIGTIFLAAFMSDRIVADKKDNMISKTAGNSDMSDGVIADKKDNMAGKEDK